MIKAAGIAFILVMLFVLGGCQQTHATAGGSSLAAASPEDAVSLTPTQTVTQAFDALLNADTETFNQFIQHTAGADDHRVGSSHIGDTFDREGRDFVQAVMLHFSYRIIKETEQGDSATVEVTFQNSDLSAVMGQLIAHAMQERDEDEDARLSDLIRRAPADDPVKTNISLSLVSQSDGWKIVLDDAAMNAICGNLYLGEGEHDLQYEFD